MFDWLAYVVIGIGLIGTGWGIVTAIANKPPGNAQIYGAAVLEVAVLVQSIVAVIVLIAGARPDEMATTIGYLIGIVVLVPLAVFWALADRSRFSGVVMAVAALSVAAMTLRLLSLWTGAGV
jgi:hypothetical protein